MSNSNLEEKVNGMIKKMKKVMVTGDYHIPYMNKGAYNVMKEYTKKYKPDVFIINGDLLDFYSISSFDKKPDRKDSVSNDVKKARKVLRDIRKTVGKSTEIHYLIGNHENRFQTFLWRHAPELYGVDGLTLKEQLRLDELSINYVSADNDYWGKDNGHLKIGDMIIMHGDSRLNGSSYSKYSCYGIKNTILNGIQNSVIQGHSHRLGKFFHNDYVGLESGSICEKIGTANWQQGFVTFEVYRNKTYNHRTHKIINGRIYEDGRIIQDGRKRNDR